MTSPRRKKEKRKVQKRWVAVTLLLTALLVCIVAFYFLEDRMSVEIEHAGMQMTAHTNTSSTAQIFMNGRWYAERNTESILVIGIDEYGSLTTTNSYNNSHQADFLVLYVMDKDTGRVAAIHLNRDTMTDIMTLGVTGEPTGSRRTQLALAYNYGNGSAQSSTNVVSAVEHLLYGIEIDNYITVTMDAVPILNDWAGGVVVEVLDDFTDVDPAMEQGELLRLDGQQALAYVRVRKDLDDSSNLHRMERQRQYATEWIGSAQHKMDDQQEVMNLVGLLDEYYSSSCTAEQLSSFAQSFSSNPSMNVYEVAGNAMQGDVYMEFHVDEAELQRLVLELFYAPVE